MNYTLLNKRIGMELIHPKFGLWQTSNIEEAREMLFACRECVKSVGMDLNDFVIIDAETKKEINN